VIERQSPPGHSPSAAPDFRSAIAAVSPAVLRLAHRRGLFGVLREATENLIGAGDFSGHASSLTPIEEILLFTQVERDSEN
jgi:hypothetical protein